MAGDGRGWQGMAGDGRGWMQGKAARDLFDRMGPDVKTECGSDPKTRVRARDRLQCIRYSPSDYSCYFGFDLKDGKSIGGNIC